MLKGSLTDEKRVALSEWIVVMVGASPFPVLPTETPDHSYSVAPSLKRKGEKTTGLDKRSANFSI